jgi:type II secretory pathway pseudopilin PulG
MKSKAFTLIEVLIAIVFITLAVVALVASNAAFTKGNAVSVELSNAEFVIEQIKELTMQLPVVDPQTRTNVFGAEESLLSAYDDLDDFNLKSYLPPIASNRQALTSLSSYRQIIYVRNVNASNFQQVVANHSSPVVRVTVDVYHKGKKIDTATWVRARY